MQILPADEYSNGTRVNVTLYDTDVYTAGYFGDKIKKAGARVACHVTLGAWSVYREWSSVLSRGNCTHNQLGSQVCGDWGTC
jgi:hypothetical protein